MMKKLNSFSVLLVSTTVMVLLMLVTIYRADNIQDDLTLLFPDLYSQLSDVDNIEFNSTQGKFSMYKQGEDWFMTEHYDYPANFNDVKRMLIDLAEAKILERKTDNSDEYYVLGVEGAEQGGSVEVTLRHGDNTVAGLVLGQSRQVANLVGPQQYFVRRQGEETSWLAEGYLQMSPIMLNWIDSEIVNLARERIARVEIIQPTGEKAELINLGVKDKFGTPQDRQKTIFKYEQLGYDIAGSLHQLRMEDVKPAKDFSRGEAEPVTTKFTTFDGLVVTTKTSFIDGFYYTTLSAEFDAAVVQSAPEDIQALNVLLSRDEVKAEVARLNERLAPWVYQVSGFVGTNLMRAKADMVTERNNVIPMPVDLTGVGASQ
jgi:hypothetical protein